MMNRILVAGLMLFLAAGSLARAQANAETTKTATLRSLGAVGDGRTDDRAALEKALNGAQGAPLDGEGLTYAVHGNIEVRTSVDLRNANLVQTMEPADTRKYLVSRGTLQLDPPDLLRATVHGLPVMHPEGVGIYTEDPVPDADELARLLPSIVLRTLSIQGETDKIIRVKLVKVGVDRGKHPQSGGRNDGAGILISQASPVDLREVSVTGDGKGTGMGISNCTRVRIDQLHIHDMNWAPYAGDDVLERLTAAEVRDEFGWNNFPIYEFRVALKRFARVRIQEQLAGIFVSSTDDVEIVNSRIERLQANIGGQLYPLQADGMTINRVKNILIKNCSLSKVWEGIDFTGAAGQDFVFEDCQAADTLGLAFKLAHPKQNGKIIGCTSERAGLSGFGIGGKSENIQLINCRALETGANGYWKKSDGTQLMQLAGFRIEVTPQADQLAPKNIRIEHCAAINKEHPGAIEYGFICEADPARHGITVTDFKSEGARLGDMHGITQGNAPATGATAEPADKAKQLAWEASVHPKYKTWPAMRYVEEDARLPRALLIGDSISIGYTTRVQDALRGKVNVLRIPVNGGSTRTGLESLDQWLGTGHWDVIHFNWGLHDLKRRKAGSSAPDQLDVLGEIEVPVQQYVANLEQLVVRLKQTGAKLIWATTTPVPAGALGRIAGQELVYNAAAAKVMQRHGILVNDLHAGITPHLGEAQSRADVHFTGPGYTLLGDQVAASILKALES